MLCCAVPAVLCCAAVTGQERVAGDHGFSGVLFASYVHTWYCEQQAESEGKGERKGRGEGTA